MPTFPKGHYAHLTRLNNAKHIAHLNTTPTTTTPTHTTTTFEFADPADLRGIPALAQGVGGTIPGTQPEQATCR